VLGGSCGARRAGQQGGKRDHGHGEDDAWKHRKQEVDDGDLQGTEGVQRKKKGGRRSGGLFCENQKLQGPHRKEEFPTDLGVYEEKPKMKVVEFFKLYNLALGLNFKNSKFTTLHDEF
jgi:hypothetical protein